MINDKTLFIKNGINHISYMKICTDARKSEITVESSVMCHTGRK